MLTILYLGDPKKPRYGELERVLQGKYDLRVYDPKESLQAQLEKADIIVDNAIIKITRDVVDAAKKVRFIQRYGIGLDHADVDYILSKGIPLSVTPGESSATALAEHALLLMLALSKRVNSWKDTIRMKKSTEPCGEELCGKTLGIIGLGASGSALAKIACGLGMNVMAVDVRKMESSETERLGVNFFGQLDSIDRLFRESDYVSIHVPLNAATREMVGSRELAMMKRTARLINVSRGAIVDEQALMEALRSARIGGAGLDVVSSEPIDPANPLLTLDNVIVSPHVAGVTFETARRRAKFVMENIDRVASGAPPLLAITSNHIS